MGAAAAATGVGAAAAPVPPIASFTDIHYSAASLAEPPLAASSLAAAPPAAGVPTARAAGCTPANAGRGGQQIFTRCSPPSVFNNYIVMVQVQLNDKAKVGECCIRLHALLVYSHAP